MLNVLKLFYICFNYKIIKMDVNILNVCIVDNEVNLLKMVYVLGFLVVKLG